MGSLARDPFSFHRLYAEAFENSQPRPLNAQATRLHPAGPYAKNGEEAMLGLFVGKMTRIISESS